jgi:hypothetical protein|tara:strand:- start:688 stop:2226 length:1539 start_codon:yes stop_codon:yes gene_type:complete
MARIRQQHPQNYTSTGNINTEFENILRYINSAELGNKSVGELLDSIFDASGDFDGVVQIRLDTTAGLQYRVGTYATDTEGWLSIAAITDIRGAAGSDVGTINAPIFFNRQDVTMATGATVIAYTFEATTDHVLVYLNGILQATSTYTVNSTANTVTLGTAVGAGIKASIYSIRPSSISNYRRQDSTAVANQVIIPFIHTDQEQILVYRNGILQQTGGSNDFTSSSSTNTVTFNSALSVNDLISIFTIENTASVRVAGLMTEDKYTDANGFITYGKLAITDAEIPVAKVATLATELADKAHMNVGSSTPTGSDGYLWVDTSGAVAELKFKESGAWLSTSPDASLPVPTSTDALRYLRVNSSGSGFDIADLNLSSVVLKTSKAAANGVASLDATGKIPTSQFPVRYSAAMYPLYKTGAVTNGSLHLMRLWKQILRVDGVSLKCEAGTCDVTMTVDGASAGSTYSVSATGSNQTFGTVIQIDATSAGKSIDFTVTNANSACVGLQVSLSTATAII